jgi:hypothetical protein
VMATQSLSLPTCVLNATPNTQLPTTSIVRSPIRGEMLSSTPGPEEDTRRLMRDTRRSTHCKGGGENTSSVTNGQCAGQSTAGMDGAQPDLPSLPVPPTHPLTSCMTSMCRSRAERCMTADSNALRATRQGAPLQAQDEACWRDHTSGTVGQHGNALAPAQWPLLS